MNVGPGGSAVKISVGGEKRTGRRLLLIMSRAHLKSRQAAQKLNSPLQRRSQKPKTVDSPRCPRQTGKQHSPRIRIRSTREPPQLPTKPPARRATTTQPSKQRRRRNSRPRRELQPRESVNLRDQLGDSLTWPNPAVGQPLEWVGRRRERPGGGGLEGEQERFWGRLVLLWVWEGGRL